MNRSQLMAVAAVFILALGVRVQSQSANEPKTVLQQLQAMKVVNQTQLEKQTALMLKLEELHKEASQIKFLTKRG
jgi:hypothetical protein